MQQTILAISGKPGLYKLISRGRANLIVESLDSEKKRIPAFAADRVTSLGDIAMYTDAEEVPLMDIFENIKVLFEGKKIDLNSKKASSKELKDFFTKVLPNWDRDRVHDSDIKKLIQWYNILIDNNITDFKEDLKPTEGDNIDNRTSDK
jgi:hypothetical protein